MKRGTKRRRTSGGSAFKIAKAALSGVKKLRRDRETKFVRFTSAANIPQVTSGATAFYLSDIDQGDGSGTRDGAEVKPTSLFFRYGVRRAFTSTNEHDYVRIVVFRDNYAKGTVATLQQVFASISVFAPLNRINAARFTVLYDKLHSLSDVGPGALTRKKYIRLSRTTKYNGTGGGSADADVNSYYLFAFSGLVDNFPVLNLDVVFNYKDP